MRRILEALPDWFGDPAGVDHYHRAAADPDVTSILATRDRDVVGVALVRRPFPETAELHLIAVAPDHLRTGVGSALLEQVVAEVRADGCHFLTVHTVGPSFDSEAYARTRAFYRAKGFHPLEEHTGLDWWEQGPRDRDPLPRRGDARWFAEEYGHRMSVWDLLWFVGIVAAAGAFTLVLRQVVGRGSVRRLQALKDGEATRLETRSGSTGSRATFFLR